MDYEDKVYETTEDEASMQVWFKEKFDLGLDFPNLPYFVDTDGFCMSE